MQYDAKANAIKQGYMNGAAGNSLDSTCILLDLPRAKNMKRSFSRHQDTVGKKIRKTVINEMKITLQMKLIANMVHDESKKY